METKHILKKIGVVGLMLMAALAGMGQNTTLIAPGATWKYLDDGSNQGTAWQDTSFNDSGWSSGAAQLGFGDGDESTTLTSGHITYYFRKSFTVADTSLYEGLDIDIIRDDGAVVYLNGNEIIRTNMPGGSVTYTTTASGNASPENDWNNFTLGKTYLQNGTNVIAVEIHQVSSGSSDISFDFDMEAVPIGTFLIESGDTWKYLDDGSNQGTAWVDTSFNDGSWASGPSQLGYGDGDEATVISYGGDPNNKHITYYFRKTFNVTNPTSIPALLLRLLRDDGAVVYLNGTEVVRDNMPGGTITYTTTASSAIGSPEEETFYEFSVDPSLLVSGSNVIAVEVHQGNNTSSDMSFDLELEKTVPSVNRGPYMNSVHDAGVTVRWRTNVATESRVYYGTDTASLTAYEEDLTSTTEHIITLTGLSPDTKYYYTVGHGTEILTGGDGDHYFTTAPATGTSQPFRAWILGDPGTANTDQADVRDAYYNYVGSDNTNLTLFLGDNAYNSGTDSEYQNALFDVYDEMLTKSVTMSCTGNHEFYNGYTSSSTQTGPYFDMFTFPTGGECGGLASGTEAYYSWDYGNIHFISMDSHDSPRGTSDPMLTWLENDLAATTQEWIVVYFHHPPYTKGSHDSDSEGRLIDMRENALPILEAYGVDLVLSGHSHSYERSYLLNGHYGYSSSYNSSTMEVDGGSGNPSTACAYRKETVGENAGEGAVYITAGSSGKISGGSLNHPAHHIALNTLGSCILDIDDNELHLRFIDDNGSIQDYFSIVKDESVQLDTTIANGQSVTLTASWTGSYSWSTGQSTQSINVSPSDTTTYIVTDPGSCSRDVFVVNVSAGNRKPTAIRDFKTTNEATAITISVLDNDMDPDGALDVSTLQIVSGAGNGSAVANTSTGEITYTPSGGFKGTDWFTYRIGDNGLPAPVRYDTTTVYVTVYNPPFTAQRDSLRGLVYLDVDLDGTFGVDDAGMGAIEVLVYEDVNDDGIIDGGDPQVGSDLTDPDGTFEALIDAPGYGEVDVAIASNSDDAQELSAGTVDLNQNNLFLGMEPEGGSTGPGNLITQGDTWKYLDDGSNQGTAWQGTGFNDASWSTGTAQFGYGDGDETTVISYGGDPNNKHITYYFRKTINVADPTVYTDIDLGILRDDGAVVYVNGTEVFRTNMPGGTITYTTTASTAIGGGDENTFYTTTFSPSLLVSGNNVIAVEIHQANATSSDLSFDFELTGAVGETLIAQGADWKYLDNGSDQGKKWRAPNYDDNGWSSGAAQLGYGDGDETTTLSYGGDANNKHITYYFRHTFNVVSANAYDFVELSLLRDDGAVVYLNGEEVYRSNMPDGDTTIDYRTTSNYIVTGTEEDSFFTAILSAELLVTGDNVLAVELHQRDSLSSDLGFDAELKGINAYTQVTGLRFTGVNVPQGVTVTEAYLTFMASSDQNASSQLVIRAEDVDNASAFTASNFNLTSRTKTADSAQWFYPEAWTAEDTFYTFEITDLAQHVVNRGGWSSGNAMALFINGSGLREAYSHDLDPNKVPHLQIKYEITGAGSATYLMQVDTNDLASGFRWSTDNLETATFSAAGQSDTDNEFPFVGSSSLCYAVGDGTNTSPDDVTYHIMNRFSGKNKQMGYVAAESVESMALNGNGDTIYAMAYGTLGFINEMTGLFTAIGGSASSANGSAGSQVINDVDGLSFDHTTNTLFGTHRIEGNFDLLLKFNRQTGAFVPNAFGAGVDYVEVDGTGIFIDVDDIAIDPVTGTIYAVNNDGGGTTQVIEIDKTSGNGTVNASLHIDDVEGQGFASDGVFYGTTGTTSGGNRINTLWQINVSTGDTVRIGQFNSGVDFEACDCMTANPNNLIYGTVFYDLDSNGVMNGADSGWANVMAYLYEDLDGDGQVDPGEPLVDSMMTNANGDYSFLVSEKKNYVLNINDQDLPVGHTLTTDNLEDAQFNAYGIVDGENNFGFHIPPYLLPVELINFTAHLSDMEQVDLTWQVGIEENLASYVVEHSLDGRTFEPINQVIAEQVYAYAAVHPDPAIGYNYYRLKMINLDGSYKYSSLEQVYVTERAEIDWLQIVPNPTIHTAELVASVLERGTYTIQIVDMSGTVIWISKQNWSTGIQRTKLPVENMEGAVYLIQLTAPNGKTRTIRLVKTR